MIESNTNITVDVARDLILRPDVRPVVGIAAILLGVGPTTITFEELRELTASRQLGATAETIWNALPERNQTLWASGSIGARAAAQLARGLHYQSFEAREILDATFLDWAGMAPLIDATGRLTGEIAYDDGGDALITQDWQAAIRRSEAETAGWVIDELRRTAAPPSRTGERPTDPERAGE